MSAVPIAAAYLVRKRQEEKKVRQKSEKELKKIKVMVTGEEPVYYGHALKSKMKTEKYSRSPVIGEYALKLSKKHPGKVTWIDIAVFLGLILAGLATIWSVYVVIHDTF